MTVNKFNIHWQIVRLKAKKISNINEKINLVISFLNQYQNVFNKGRVKHWLKTSSISCNEFIRPLFIDAINDLEKLEYSLYDIDNNLSLVSIDDLKAVYTDLINRKRQILKNRPSKKHGTRFCNVPKSHIQFLKALEKELSTR